MLRGLAASRASESAGKPVYDHAAVRTETYLVPELRGSEELITKERALSQCDYYDQEFCGLIHDRCC